MATLEEGYFVARNWWLRWEKGIFGGGIGGYVGRRVFCGGIGIWLSWEKGVFVAGLVATLGEGHFCDGIDGYVGRREFLRDCRLRWEKGILVAELLVRWEKGIFVPGLVATLGEGHFWGRDWWLRWEKSIFVAGFVATLGEGHFCGGTGSHVGRRAAKLRDGWPLFENSRMNDIANRP
jgi:hypothetical protein